MTLSKHYLLLMGQLTNILSIWLAEHSNAAVSCFALSYVAFRSTVTAKHWVPSSLMLSCSRIGPFCVAGLMIALLLAAILMISKVQAESNKQSDFSSEQKPTRAIRGKDSVIFNGDGFAAQSLGLECSTESSAGVTQIANPQSLSPDCAELVLISLKTFRKSEMPPKIPFSPQLIARIRAKYWERRKMIEKKKAMRLTNIRKKFQRLLANVLWLNRKHRLAWRFEIVKKMFIA